MSEMVERVANTLKNFRPADGDVPLTDEVWCEVARTAIQAMREPTIAMLSAAWRCDEAYDDSNGTANDHWSAMIDAAMK